MLQQIVSHTPVYVWIILALLVSRGVAASRDRVMPLRRVFILPVAMVVLSLMDISTRFGLDGLPFAAWIAGVAASAALVLRAGGFAQAGRADGTVFVPGSWTPLALMMAVFAIKYALGAAGAMHPELMAQTGFATAACALSGLVNGVLTGRALRYLPALRGTATA